MSAWCDGDPNAPICVVAMAPGREELASDRPLVGGSGKMLWSIATRRGGFTRADCYILNVIGEWPEGSTGSPSAAQLSKWWDTFDENLKKSRARLMLLLGGDALVRVMGVKGGIEAWRGYLMRPADRVYLTRTKEVQGVYKTSNKARGIKKGDPRTIHEKVSELCPIPETVEYVIPTLHPAAVLRSGFGSLPAFAADIARAGRAHRSELRPYRVAFSKTPTPAKPTQSLVIDIENCPLPGGGWGGVDRVGIATDEDCWTAPWSAESKGRLLEQMALNSGPIVAHNIAHEAKHLPDSGIDLPEPWFCTMLAALMLQPDLYKGLNPVSSLYLDRPRWKHLSDEDPEFYNAQDNNACRELYLAEVDALKRHGQYDLFTKTIMPVIPVLVEMTKRGIPLDGGRRGEWVDTLTTQRNDHFAKWSSLAGGVNPQSPKQLAGFLYGTLGLEEQFNKYGGTTADAASIKTLLADPKAQEHRPVLETLLSYRQVSKLLETYAQVPIGDDGCVHPSWLPAGKDDDGFGKGLAGTWRITSHGPNFQNQPPEARKLFIPPAGWVFIEADWSQIEARIIAELSGDPNLKAAIAAGLHAANMRLLGVDKTRAKNAFYGWSYGAGKRVLRRTFLAHGFDIPEAECGALLRRFDEVYPRVAAWRKSITDEMAKTYSLRNPFGLRRHFYRGSADAPAGFDYLPQSSAAMCMWSVARGLRDDLQKLCGGALFALVHDSILIGAPAESAHDAGRLLKEHMEQEFPQIGKGFYVPVEMKWGSRSWGELEKLELLEAAA